MGIRKDRMMLNLKDKKEKLTCSYPDNIYCCFGAIEGILGGYEEGILTPERALDDIRDITDLFNNSKK